MKRTILITGATGNLGAKLRRHFEGLEYTVKLLCLNPGHDPAVRSCDLSEYDESWAEEFRGVDTVLHAAADPHPWASWESVQRLNLDMVCNVLAASHRHGVRRVVFASSNFVMAGERFTTTELSTDIPPHPINAYGASKLAGERIGKMFAERFGLSFIAFRIGVCLREHNNEFGPWLPFGLWGQQMWVSDRDLCQAFQKAVENETVRYAVYNLVSENDGSRWDLQDVKNQLGYAPEDRGHVRVGALHRSRAAFAYLRDHAIPTLLRKLPGRTW